MIRAKAGFIGRKEKGQKRSRSGEDTAAPVDSSHRKRRRESRRRRCGQDKNSSKKKGHHGGEKQTTSYSYTRTRTYSFLLSLRQTAPAEERRKGAGEANGTRPDNKATGKVES
ncbi:hypothetical protein BRADI_3g36541v3 [Brachypodium distachyon]|uniref:Uncharacterized protein n=1 Tax=Brachypodium distachyon TaxID=15368 RepID=A0A2K2D1H9_BRADI|nr:hypothetical protein BRADI_3g36541v3 [Brachypodium distachyon]